MELNAAGVAIINSIFTLKPRSKPSAQIDVPAPYSPDLKQIDNASAKLKSQLRQAATRTVEDLWPPWSPQSTLNRFNNKPTKLSLPDM